MKTHHVLLTLGAIAIGAAIIYEYHKKHTCGCKKGKGCSCQKKQAVSTGTKLPVGVMPKNPVANGQQTIVPPTGFPDITDMFQPNDSWQSADGEDYPVIEPVKEYFDESGVRRYSDQYPDIIKSAKGRLINS